MMASVTGRVHDQTRRGGPAAPSLISRRRLLARRLLRIPRATERVLGFGILGVCLSAFIVVPYVSQDPSSLNALPQQPPSGRNWSAPTG